MTEGLSAARRLDSVTTLKMAALIFVGSLALIAQDVLSGTFYIKDVDDVLREWQIRALFSGHSGWFDMVLPGIAMPQPYLSPWSRLIDLPYVVLGYFFDFWLSADKALHAAFVVWPLMMCGAFCWLLARIGLHQFAGQQISRPLVITCFLTMPIFGFIGVYEFTPTRIDHHNVQILAMLAMLYGLLRWDGRGGWIGVSSGLSLLIGLECLPLTVLAYAGLVLADVAGAAGSRRVILHAVVSLAVTSLAGGLIFVGPAGLAATECDSFSAPYWVAVLGASLAVVGALWMTQRITSWWVKLGVYCLLGGVLLAVLGLLFPACIGGPYAIIDPLSRSLWFNHIHQENSSLYFYRYGEYRYCVIEALWAVVAAGGLPVIWKSWRVQPGLVIAFIIAACSLALTLLLIRYIRFAAVMVSAFLPLMILTVLTGSARSRKIAASAVAFVVIGFTAPIFLVSSRSVAFDAADSMGYPACPGADFSTLQGVAVGKVVIPQGIALPFLFGAPEGFSVAGIPFHRASPGMRRTFEAFLSEEAEVRQQALAPFDYVGFCATSPVFGKAPAGSILSALQHGLSWPGLMPVLQADGSPVKLQLLRIDHAKLR